MTTLATLLDPIVADLGSLEGVTSCEAVGGKFDLPALERFGAKAPAIRVAILRLTGFKWVDTGEVDATVDLGAFIVTRDERGLPRDLAVLRLVQAVIVKVHAERWGQKSVQAARPVRAENLYSGGIQNKGLALWGVSWTTKLRMGTDAFAAPAGSAAIWCGDEEIGTLGDAP
ncbi:hypothetical protein EJV44_04670 [Ancylobacter aquaticus]|nr:hypothetical protein EJV44_04670 [Ancylobacter aquaticus]